MTAFEEINSGARFDEEQDLCRLLDCREIGQRLLDPVIEYMEVPAMEAFHKVSACIGDNHADVDAVHIDADRLRLLL